MIRPDTLGKTNTPVPGLLHALIGEYMTLPSMVMAIDRVSDHYGLTDADRATLSALVFHEIGTEESEHPADRWSRILLLRSAADNYPVWRPTLLVVRDVARRLGVADLSHAAEICALMAAQGYLEARVTPNSEDHEYKWLRAFQDPT